MRKTCKSPEIRSPQRTLRSADAEPLLWGFWQSVGTSLLRTPQPVPDIARGSVENSADAYHCCDVSRPGRGLPVSASIRSDECLVASEFLGSTGSFLWRVATDEIMLSEELCRLLAFDPVARVTLTRIGARLHPEDRPLLRAVLERARRGDGDIDHECRLRMPDRSIRWLRVVARGRRDRNRGLEYVGAVRDVTELLLLRAELEEAKSQLVQLARAVSLGPVAAAIAHEISQPLSGIVINASACLRMLAASPPDVEGARETMRRTLRDSSRTAEIVARVRAHFARKEPTVENVDLNAAIRETVDLSLRELQREHVDPVVELDEGLPLVAGDAVQLQQVIMNLLRNAADAMRGVSNRHRRVLVRSSRQWDNRVCVSVRDTGVGLEAETSERLFHPFYSTKSGGMGIGLAISRSIIEGHGGQLWAEANDGPGATFAFSLPLTADSAGLSRGLS